MLTSARRVSFPEHTSATGLWRWYNGSSSTRSPASDAQNVSQPRLIWYMIYLTAIGLTPGGSSAYLNTNNTQNNTNKKNIEQHIIDAKQYIEQHNSLIRKNADRAPSRVSLQRGFHTSLPFQSIPCACVNFTVCRGVRKKQKLYTPNGAWTAAQTRVPSGTGN
jgi:hypothetical protein